MNHCGLSRSGVGWMAGLAVVSQARADWVAINLNPPGWSRTAVYAVTPARQFGTGVAPSPPFLPYQALSWAGLPGTLAAIGPQNIGGTVRAASGDWQVGSYGASHAALWHGAAGSPLDLHPPGYFYSEADAVFGGQQFGYTELTANSYPSAAMWSGTAASYINLHPAGYFSSAISSAWGGQQGGGALLPTGNWPGRAGLWGGTAQSFVSIDPGAPYLQSYVLGMAQGEQVGAATGPSTFDHACLWHGTAASFVDLDPGWDYSRAFATVGGAQVGWTTLDFSNNTHAVIWFGTAAGELFTLTPAGKVSPLRMVADRAHGTWRARGWADRPMSEGRAGSATHHVTAQPVARESGLGSAPSKVCCWPLTRAESRGRRSEPRFPQHRVDSRVA